MPVYDTAVLHQLLSEAFNQTELNRLTLTLFRSLQEELPNSLTKSERIEQIVAFAKRQGRLPDLITYVETENPFKHQQFKDRLVLDEEEPDPVDVTIAELEASIKQEQRLLVQYEEMERAETPTRAAASKFRKTLKRSSTTS